MGRSITDDPPCFVPTTDANYQWPPFLCPADTAVTGRQEGGLQDAGVEALHLLLSHLLRGRDTYGIGKEQKEALLKTLRRGRNWFPCVCRSGKVQNCLEVYALYVLTSQG